MPVRSRSRLSVLPSRMSFVFMLVASSVFALGCAKSKESVHSELIRLQKENGLDLVSLTSGRINVVNYVSQSLQGSTQFADGGVPVLASITVDGTEIAFLDCSPLGADRPNSAQNCNFPRLATIHVDGTHFRQYAGLIYPAGMCWSHDKTKLALSVCDRRQNPYAVNYVYVLDLGSGQLHQAAGFENWTTTQCWSPDDSQFAYMENKAGGIQNVLVYDMRENKSRFLARGAYPTWSPDGQWISFLVQTESYDAIHPTGDGRKVLFKTFGVSELWWSPDSRFVAYVSVRGVFERSPFEQFAELTRLRVRRLDDDSEDWFLNLGSGGLSQFQWVQNTNLSKPAQER